MSGKYNSNTSTMSSQQANTLDGLVHDYFRYTVDVILKDRKSKMNPIISSSQLVTQMQPPSLRVEPVDHIAYINSTLAAWKKSLSKPMTLDIYLYHSQLQQHILIERWTFSYQPNTDFSNKKESSSYSSSSSNSSSSSSRLFAVVNRRIQTFVRSLYCFVRLLPGFNLLQLSRIEPFMHFQIYESKLTPSNFYYEVSKHHFPSVATTKGKLNTSLQFINSAHVMEIIKTINGGAIIGASPALSSSPEMNKASSMPIPINGNNASAPSRGRTHTSDDPYRRSFHRPSEILEAGPHARSYESNLPHPIAITGQRQRDSYEGEAMLYSNPIGYSLGSTPPVSSYSQNTPPFAHYPMNNQDDGSSDGGNSTTEMTGPSPPYSQYSSSLNSTSPQGPYNALVDHRRHSFSKKSQISSSFGRPSPTPGFNLFDYDKLRTKITLPASPFILAQYNTNSANSSGTQLTIAGTSPSLAGIVSHPNITTDPLYLYQQTYPINTTNHVSNSHAPPATNDDTSNKLDFVIQFEKEKERRMSDIYLDIMDRSRSISGITRDEELEKLNELLDSHHPSQPRHSSVQLTDEEMPFAVPPSGTNDIASSIFGYSRPSHVGMGPATGSMSESNTYYSLTAVSGELMSKLNEFKEFRSNIRRD